MLVALGHVRAGVRVSLRRIVSLGLAFCATLALGAAFAPASANAGLGPPPAGIDLLARYDLWLAAGNLCPTHGADGWNRYRVQFSDVPNHVLDYQACKDTTPVGEWLNGTHTLTFVTAEPGCKTYSLTNVRMAYAFVFVDHSLQRTVWWSARTSAVEVVCGLDADDVVEIRAMACYDQGFDRKIDLMEDIFGDAFQYGLTWQDEHFKEVADIDENRGVDLMNDIFGVATQFALDCDDFAPPTAWG